MDLRRLEVFAKVAELGSFPRAAEALFLEYARRMLKLAEEARQAIDHFPGRMSGTLVVGGSTPSPASTCFPR